MISLFGRKGPILSISDPNNSTRDGVVDDQTASAVYRRLTRALADLGIAPQPIGPRVENWSTLVDGVVTFGALSVVTAARLANLLEDIAAGRTVGSTDENDVGTCVASCDSGQTFEPVASPFEAGSGPSRFHPRVAF